MRFLTLAIILQASFVFSQDKLPIPDTVSKKKASAEIKELFGGEFSKAKTPTKKVKLAKKLLQEGVATKGNPTSRYVLFRIAKDIAAGAGDADTAFKAIDQMDKFYKIDSLRLKSDTLIKAAKNTKTKNATKVIVEKGTLLIEDAVKKDKYDLAKQLGKITLAAARKVRDLDAAKKIVERNKEIKIIAQEYEEIKFAFATLETKPADSTANTKVGKFYCLAKGNWERGLPMLVLGSDATLKTLAVKELQGPKNADFLMLGEGWWQQAAKAEGLAQKQLQAHAAIWFRKAMPRLTGIDKTRVAKRLEQVPTKTTTNKKLTVKPVVKHPAGAVQFEGHWYKLYPGRIPWTTAAQQCQRLEGQLVCIETAAEAQFVARLARGNRVWLGGFRNARGQWMWVNGKPITVKFWSPGRPDNAGGIENHLEVDPKGTWDDVRKDGNPRSIHAVLGYICEWEK